MVDPLKFRGMVGLASYEEGQGRSDREICRYFRSDYVAVCMIQTFVSVTIAYFLIIALAAVGYIEEILAGISNMDLAAVGKWLVIIYLAMLVIWLIVTFAVSMNRYNAARRRMDSYRRQIGDLIELKEIVDRKG